MKGMHRIAELERPDQTIALTSSPRSESVKVSPRAHETLTRLLPEERNLFLYLLWKSVCGGIRKRTGGDRGEIASVAIAFTLKAFIMKFLTRSFMPS